MTMIDKELLEILYQRVASFFRERVVNPVVAMYVYRTIDTMFILTFYSFNELWRGRESFSDQKAREVAIESLKKMIKSWLDETYADMPDWERSTMAESMDITLLEKKKEESMKTLYEINNVIRMSFIEMQYMKKVRQTCALSPKSHVSQKHPRK